MSKAAIAYYRVSTDKQGRSGLGLEAQRAQVQEYLAKNNLALVAEYTEVESTRRRKRPVLDEALKACKKQKAVLLIAKLDRLGRSVAFISSLMEFKVEFVAVDFPQANKLTLHMLSAFAEYERDQISLRTKSALKAAKKRGVKLGQHGKRVLSKQNRQAANRFAKQLKPTVETILAQGFKTIRAIRDEFNARNIATFRGGGSKWHIATVHGLLKRLI